MRKVEHIMGMPVSIDLPDVEEADTFDQVFDFLRHVDETYSPYRSSSEVSRFSNGDLKREELTDELRRIIDACDRYQRLTDGYFSAYYDGHFDPTGYVKGWAIDSAAEILRSMNIDTFLINIAGDVVAYGPQKMWRLGIQDPFNTQGLLGIVSLHDQALATSGSYEKGNHIINPHTGIADSDLVSASVYGPDCITADVLATTYIAMGSIRSRELAKKYPTYATMLVDKDGGKGLINGFDLQPLISQPG